MRHGILLAIALPSLRLRRQRTDCRILAFGDSGYHYAYRKPTTTWREDATRRLSGTNAFDWLKTSARRPKSTAASYRRPNRNIRRRAAGGGRSSRCSRYCEGPRACEFAVMLGQHLSDGRPRGRRPGRCGTLRRILPAPTRRSRRSRGIPDLLALGNHDWRPSREGAMAQVRYHESTRPFHMDVESVTRCANRRRSRARSVRARHARAPLRRDRARGRACR